MKIKIIKTSTDSKKTALTIGKALMNNNLSPCVQIIPSIQTLYLWNKKMELAKEYLLVIKTLPKNVQECSDLIYSNHNYKIPEILISDETIINSDYSDWFIKNIN